MRLRIVRKSTGIPPQREFSGYQIQQSVNFGDVIMLGSISDVEGFKVLMLATPLPSIGENCQSWIRKVVREAVRQGKLPASATAKVETVPIRP